MSGIPAPDEIFARAAPLIEQAEGFSPAPYRDAAGKATIGWGSTFYPDGRAVTMRDAPVSRAAADTLMRAAMAQAWNALTPHLARVPTLNQGAALLSLAYNIGAEALRASLLLAKFNAGDTAGAAAEFPRWNKAHIGGALAVLPGLAVRRRREQALFLAPDFKLPGKEIP